MPPDSIAEQLSEREKIERNRDAVSDTHTIVSNMRWVAIGTLMLALLLIGAAALLFSRLEDTGLQVHESEVRISARIDKIPASLPAPKVSVELQQWTSVAFAPGSVVCDSSDKSPCNCWYAGTDAGTGDCVAVGTIAARNRDTVAVMAIGGHDKARLKPRSEGTLKSNDNIAMTRAGRVANSFVGSFESSTGVKLSDVRYMTRGVWDKEKQSSSDRTVTITLVKVERLR